MLINAKNRIWPSPNSNNCANMRFQPPGDTKGKIPSITKTRAMASQIVSLLKAYFLAGVAGATPPRNTLKNSEDAGSNTMTSLLLLKLAL